MTDPSRSPVPDVARIAPLTAIDWPRLLADDSPELALLQLGPWLGATRLDLHDGEGDDPWAGWAPDRGTAGVGAGSGALRRYEVIVRGEPAWTLRVTADEGVSTDRLARAGAVLEAWRAAREERARAEARIEARSRELDLIQSLGRRAAEARTPESLFRATVEVMQQGESLDAAVIVSVLDRRARVMAYLTRPVESSCLGALAARTADLLGLEAEAVASAPCDVTRLQEFDERGPRRARFDDGELIVLPIQRRHRVVACMVCLPTGRGGLGTSRLLFGAVNQLSLHLERILTVREAEAGRLRSMLDSMPQAVVLTDPGLVTSHANRAAQEWFRRFGWDCSSSLEEAVRELDIEAMVAMVRDGASRGVSGEATAGPDGRRHVLDVSVSPLLGDGARVDGLVFVLSDVTESRRLQQHLAQSDKMSSLGQMISGVAHELNNPLSSVIGYAQLLRRSAQADSPELRRLQILENEAERCRKIVQNLLTFARRRAPERKPFSLNDVVHSVLGLVGYHLRAESVEVETRLDAGLPALHGDMHQFQQVLLNLITNARHALAEHPGPRRILIRSGLDELGSAVCEVIDNGPGVPVELHGKIFDPFFTTKREGLGTGLGLSIVYGIVTDHGGTIEIVSAGAGSGAHFRLRFPVAAPSAVARPAPEASPAAPEAGEHSILVVDDEEPIARMLCETLSLDGHRVRAVSSGREALEWLERADFDVIISDLKMPGMDGGALVERIRRVRPGWRGRLMLTTGDTVSEEPESLARRNGLELIHKPFDLDQLRRRVLALPPGGGEAG